MAKKDSAKLDLWQKRLAEADSAFSAEVKKMNERELLYDGDRTLRPLVPGDTKRDGTLKRTSHVRNIVKENIDSMISSSIPQPKVTPRHKEDEHLAETIEHFLRNELDRLPMETINDMMERTVPIQGGAAFLIEWDNSARTRTTVGELAVRATHPKQFAPQPGVDRIEDMDWFIVKIPTTKEAVRREFGVSVADEGESEPDVRSADAADAAEDAVTRYVGYARNDNGGMDRYSWVNDVELEDLEDYQARRLPVCDNCGTVQLPGGGPCPVCGGEKFTEKEQEDELIYSPFVTSGGLEIPGAQLSAPPMDMQAGQEPPMPVMEPTRIPYYKPDMYPIVLQKNVSSYGRLLGSSDVDAIRDQQNTLNRLYQKVIDRIVKSGTRITLPDRPELRTDPEDGERWFIGDPADKALIDVYDFKGDLKYEFLAISQVYEEARQILGITDSFQGRRDTTAVSGKAKEFAAAQSAGRLESKRVMKDAAYASIFELMFKFWLAYSDEPRNVSYKDFNGETKYETMDRHDFLKVDAAGEYYWNDQFLFSVDTSASLAGNREAMWQETRNNLQTGAFGDPAQYDTLLMFWTVMEDLHYPNAGKYKANIEDRLQRQQQQAMMQQMMAQQAAQQQAMMQSGASQHSVPADLARAIDEKARQDAMQTIRQNGGMG